MSVPETDIALLKQAQTDMRAAMDSANRSTTTTLSHINGRLDGFSDLLKSVAVVVERQEQHGRGLDRAFEEIKEVKDDMAERDDQDKDWRDKHIAENSQTEKKLSMWHGLAIGISVMVGVVLGVLAWTGNDIIATVRGDVIEVKEDNKRDDQRLDRLERIEARHHGEQ